MSVYPYKQGYLNGVSAFKIYIKDIESTRITSHEAALRVARRAIVIPREISRSVDSSEAVANFTEGFIDGFTMSWKGHDLEHVP